MPVLTRGVMPSSTTRRRSMPVGVPRKPSWGMVKCGLSATVISYISSVAAVASSGEPPTKVTMAAAAAVISLVLAGCGTGTADGAEPGPRTHEKVAVYTWWAAGVEKKGLDKLVEVFEEQHPEIEFVNDGLMGGGGSSTSLRPAALARSCGEEPPAPV